MAQIHEDEERWSGFLIDKDAESAKEFFGGNLAQAHDDPDIVEEAWRGRETIVTSNGDDFIRHIDAFQRRENGKDCRDLWSLIIIPNKALIRERVLPPIVRNGVETPAGRILWPAVGYLNLCLTVESDGTLNRRRFRRCSHCERDSPIKLPWYRNLPVIGSKAHA